jgi:hypothetical protein
MKPKTKLVMLGVLIGLVLGSAFVGSYWLASSVQSVAPDIVASKVKVAGEARLSVLQGWQANPRHEWVYCGSGAWEGDVFTMSVGRFATVYNSTWFSAQFEPCNSVMNVHPHYNGYCQLSADDLYSFGSMGKTKFMAVMCSPSLLYVYSTDDLNSPLKVSLI